MMVFSCQRPDLTTIFPLPGTRYGKFRVTGPKFTCRSSPERGFSA